MCRATILLTVSSFPSFSAKNVISVDQTITYVHNCLYLQIFMDNWYYIRWHYIWFFVLLIYFSMCRRKKTTVVCYLSIHWNNIIVYIWILSLNFTQLLYVFLLHIFLFWAGLAVYVDLVLITYSHYIFYLTRRLCNEIYSCHWGAEFSWN